MTRGSYHRKLAAGRRHSVSRRPRALNFSPLSPPSPAAPRHGLARALSKLGYTDAQIKAIVEHIDKQETIEGAPYLK